MLADVCAPTFWPRMRKVYVALLWSDAADLFDGAPIHADTALAAAQHQLSPGVSWPPSPLLREEAPPGLEEFRLL